MKALKVRNVVIGEGAPKICIPIVGETREEIFSQAAHVKKLAPDLAEWRMDWYEGVYDVDSVWETLKGIRKVLGAMPLIATFRTSKEGGLKEIGYAQYEEILLAVAKSGMADLVDVEAFSFGEISEALIERIHMCGVRVVASYHDFLKTPTQAELLNRLRKLQNMGADIPKVAVMPQNPGDVLTLMSVTYQMASEYADRPIITMSMAGYGSISRMSGEIFGSAVTFASAGQSSAPGQLPVGVLRTSLEAIHKNLIS